MKSVRRGPKTGVRSSLISHHHSDHSQIGKRRTVVETTADETSYSEHTVEHTVGRIRERNVFGTSSTQVGYSAEHSDCTEAEIGCQSQYVTRYTLNCSPGKSYKDNLRHGRAANYHCIRNGRGMQVTRLWEEIHTCTTWGA